MAVDLPSRRPSATPEGPIPQGPNPGIAAKPGNIAGGSNMPEQHVPRRHGKDPVQPEEPAYQDYNEEDDDQGYFEGDYFTTEAELEIERLRRLLAKKDQDNQNLTRQLAEANKKQAGRPRKKKSQSTRRNETEVTETATVHTEAQTRTGPMTRQQAARAADGTRNQATSAQVPQGPRQPPSPIRHPPSPIRHPKQPQNDPILPANAGRGSRGNRALDQE